MYSRNVCLIFMTAKYFKKLFVCVNIVTTKLEKDRIRCSKSSTCSKSLQDVMDTKEGNHELFTFSIVTYLKALKSASLRLLYELSEVCISILFEIFLSDIERK